MYVQIATLIFLLFLLSNFSLADEYYFKDGRVKEAQAKYVEGPYLELNFLEKPEKLEGLFIYDIGKVKGPSSFSSDLYRRSAELLEKGNHYFFVTDYAKALSCYQKALDINPVYIYARHNRAVVFFAERKYDEAISELKNIIKIDKNNAGAYFNLGIIYRYLGNWRLAKDCFQKAKAHFLMTGEKKRAALWIQKADKFIKEAQSNIMAR